MRLGQLIALAVVIVAALLIPADEPAARATVRGVHAGTIQHSSPPTVPADTSGTEVRTEMFEARMADGTVLRGHLYLPEAPGPLATVLELSPYFESTAVVATTYPTDHTNDEPALRAVHHRLLDDGFAVAQVNMRGTGRSDGCFQWGSRTDWTDAGEVVKALAGQHWSNGNVGMIGHSFAGWSQYMAAAAAPPALKAVIPTSGVIDVWSLLTRRGAPIHIGPAVPTVWNAGTAFGADTPVETRVGCGGPLAAHTTENAQLARTGDRTPYMVERDLRPALRDSQVAALATNGLIAPAEGHHLQSEGLWDLLRRDRSRLVLGQWGHATPSAGRDDWLDTTSQWLDHHLRAGARAVEPGVVEYEDTAGEWHTAPSWPPPHSHQRLLLSASRLVDKTRDVVASEATFATADLDPGSACGPHQALYVSTPLERDLLLAGNFQARLTVTSTLPGGNLTAFLRHTPGDGSCQDVAENSRAVGRVQLDLRHWDEAGRSRDFPVDTPTMVDVPSQPLASFVPRGHRLVLAVGGGSQELEPDPLRPILTISTGRAVAGELVLPVVEGPLRFASDAQVQAGRRSASSDDHETGDA